MEAGPTDAVTPRLGIGFSIGAGISAVLLAWFATSSIRANAGGPAVPLDDSYIHFQYARSIAELHPFRYTEGAAPTPGATSLLWPLVLAPFYAVGFRAERLIWVAWALGFIALGFLACEVAHLARGLVENATAVAAGTLVLTFGGFTWFAASGMEVIPFAWLLTRTVRRSSEWLEAKGSEARAQGGPGYRELILLAALCPSMRPEGVIGSGCVAAALLFAPRNGRRVFALPVFGTPLLPPLVGLLFTGQAVASTAVAKWLPLNPYYGGGRLAVAVTAHGQTFFGTLLDGRLWTSVFLPEGYRLVFTAAPFALLVVGRLRGRAHRAALALVFALAILIPTTYETFLVNRVRYIWPFLPAWFVGLAALGELVGEGVQRLLRRASIDVPNIGAALVAAVAAFLALRIPPSIEDLSTSSSAVTYQQVALGKWAREALAKTTRLGVNDTGAIAYFSGHPTFDIVGLTTAGEARYWSAGPGSRFEHYERMSRSALPEYFIVYAEWFGIKPLLGERIESRSVRHTILGGETMTAFVARYDLLHSGANPTEQNLSGRRQLDALDVADVDDETAHRYELFDATQPENVVVADDIRADGARLARTRDSFVLRLAPGGVLVARLGATAPTQVSVRVDGKTIGEPAVSVSGWDEIVVPLPADVAAAPATVSVEANQGAFASLHYWSYE